MPIEFECSDCGKALRVRDEVAGKRVKCPGCATALTVPSADEPEERPAPRKASIKAPPRLEDDRPVRKRRDPDEEDERPAAKRRPDEEDDRPSRKRRDPDDDREEQDEDDSPRGKKKGKARKGGGGGFPLVLVLGIGGGAFALLLVGGLVLWLLMGSGGGGGSMALYVPADGQGFASVRLAELWKSEAARTVLNAARQQPGFTDPEAEMEKMYGLKPDQIERATTVLQDAMGNNAWSIIETAVAYDQEKIKAKLVGATEQTHEGKKYFVGNIQGMPQRMAVHFVGSKMFVIGPEESVKRALDVAAKPRVKGPLDDGLALVGGGKHVVVGFSLPPAAMAQMRQAAQGPQAAPFAALGEFQSGTVTANVGAALEVETALRFPGDAQAKSGKDAADKLVNMAQTMLPFMKGKPGGPPEAAQMVDAAEKALNGLKIEQRGPQMVVSFKAEGLAENLAKAVPQMGKMMGGMGGMGGGGMGGGQKTTNDLKQILLAFHSHHDAMRGLPTDILDAKGQPLLSWRVAILPYIEQDALYKQFKLDERWDGPTNRPLMQRMPSIYTSASTGPGRTRWARFIGAGTIFTNERVRPQFQGISDGSSNTIMVFEAAQAVEWTKPGDAAYSATVSPKGWMFNDAGMYLVGMADGSVRRVKATVSDKTMHAAVTAKGGEPLGPDF